MSVSPPKEGAEAGDAPSETSETMERGEEAQAREAYDFEVKEQDRWLPIANGWSFIFLPCFISFCLKIICAFSCRCAGCTMMERDRQGCVACATHAQQSTGFPSVTTS